MHRKVAAALLAVLALGVAGCGGSERTLTRADLVRQVELACRAGQQEMQRQGSARGLTGAAATAHFLDAVLAAQHVVVDRIRDYAGSGDAKTDFADFKQAMQQRLAVFERVHRAGTADLRRAIAAEQAQAEALTRRVQESARRLGIEGCT